MRRRGMTAVTAPVQPDRPARWVRAFTVGHLER